MKCIISLVAISLFIFSTKSQDQKSASVDSLLVLTQSNQHDTTRADAHIKLSLFLYQQNFDTLLYFNSIAYAIAQNNLRKEISLTEKKKFLQLLSESGGNVAYYYQNIGELDSAITLYRKSLQIDFQMNNYSGVSVNLNNLGMVYNYQGKIQLSLQYFLKSLEIDEALNDLEYIGSSYNNVAYIYEHQGDTVSALRFYQKALDNFILNQDSSNIALAHINIGSVYRKSNDEKSFEHFKEALKISKLIDSRYALSASLHNLGNYYLHQDQLDTAKVLLTQANQEYKTLNDPSGISITYMNLGMIAHKEGNNTTAKKYGLDALKIAEKIDNAKAIEQANKLLSLVERELGNFKASLEYFTVHKTISDSLQNLRTQRFSYQQKVNYEYQKRKELDDMERAQSIAIAEKESEHQSKISTILAAFSLLIGLALMFIIYKLVQTSKQKTVILQKNKENELLLGEIHHRVKNNLQVISSLLSLQEKNISDDAAKQAILEGKERVKSMGLIHKMLYQNDNFSGVEMKQYIQELIRGLQDSFGLSSNEVQVSSTIHDIKLDVDSAIPIGLIINELIINAFKYAFDGKNKGELTVNLLKTNDSLLLQIQDNGKGNVTDIKNSKSFGTKLVKSLTRQLKGELNINSAQGLKYDIFIKDFKLVE